MEKNRRKNILGRKHSGKNSAQQVQGSVFKIQNIFSSIHMEEVPVWEHMQACDKYTYTER